MYDDTQQIYIIPDNIIWVNLKSIYTMIYFFKILSIILGVR
jgi:hypothetical protein